jgi:4'-phosphopantetheinyl transferase EntD
MGTHTAKLKVFKSLGEAQDRFAKDLSVDFVLKAQAHTATGKKFGIRSLRELEFKSGRLALAACLKAARLPSDVEQVIFPNTSLSLAHTDVYAVAALKNSKKYLGIGVDLEEKKTFIQERALRLYFSPNELERMPTMADQIMRLMVWVAKEAVFKADLNNKGRVLGNYSLQNFEPYGKAQCDLDGGCFTYSCHEWRGNLLAVAVKTTS